MVIATEFTPMASLVGGAMIGLATVLLMAMIGRIFGATGLLTGALFSAQLSETGWRLAVIAGMLVSPFVYLLATNGVPEIQIPVSRPLILIGGVIVGIGVYFGGGCTSGHGVWFGANVAPLTGGGAGVHGELRRHGFHSPSCHRGGPMMRYLLLFAIGVLFGLGISVSGMINPAKVINFFDIAGAWDPSLAFVMGGALAVTALGYRLVLRRPYPLLADGFSLPTSKTIDRRLLLGSAAFGIGWGIAGFCPGAALPALGTGMVDAILFVAALIAGIGLARWLDLRRQKAG